MNTQGRRLVLVTRWAYPFGGGEAFMYDTLKWCAGHFAEILWLSFSTVTPAGPVRHKLLSVERVQPSPIPIAHIHAPSGSPGDAIDPKALQWWLMALDPDVVHHQGADRSLVAKTCIALKIPLLTGFHFWHGAVVLSVAHENTNILRHIHEHKPDPELAELLGASDRITCYWASPFMQTVTQMVNDRAGTALDLSQMPIICPVSDEAMVAVFKDIPMSARQYVTQINVHPAKGGHVLLHCAERLLGTGTMFQCVVTEPIASNNDFYSTFQLLENMIVLARTDDIASIYASTKILLVPSMVDETFCRVAFEGLMNGLPIIASPAGYLREMLHNCDGALLMPETNSDPEMWASTLSKVLTEPGALERMSFAARRHYERVLLPEYRSQAKLNGELLHLMRDKSPRNNVMLFVPWADQGLGVQARNYVSLLDTYYHGRVNTCIFSFKPYYDGRHQRDATEWEHPRCYYSDNIREEVTEAELKECVERWNVGTVIMPETCWFRVFQLAQYLRKRLHVRVYAIPNVEIVRTDELGLHESSFNGILCNNEACLEVFQQYSTHLGQMSRYIGYAIDCPARPAAIYRSGVVRLLCIGGMNAFSRKQIDQVCRALLLLSPATQAKLHLTVTNQNLKELEQMQSLKELMAALVAKHRVRILWDSLSYKDIIALYGSADVVIQVSKHEGLGIGFYEALAHGKPVVTLDVPPHNEVIRPGVNGWLVPATLRLSSENPMAPIGSAYFDPADLANCLARDVLPVVTDQVAASAMSQSLNNDYHVRFSPSRFAQRLAQNLRIGHN